MTENWRVKMARFFAGTFLLARGTFSAAAALAFMGEIRVIRTCSRRRAATAFSMVSAARSPLTISPARVRPV